MSTSTSGSRPLTRKSRANESWVSTCKICRLFISHPDLWLEIHDKKNRQAWKISTLLRWLNEEKLKEINESRDEIEHIKPFNRENFNRHFSGLAKDGTTGHCQDFLLVKHIIESGRSNKVTKAASRAITVTPETFKATDLLLDGINEKMTEFTSLTQMVTSLEKILTYYDKTLKDRITNKEAITIEEIEGYQKQVSSLVKLKSDMSKLRNTTTIAGDAVKKAIELTVVHFIETLLPLVEEARQALILEYPGSSLPSEITNMILNRQRSAMKDILVTILNKVLTEYKIK